MSPPLVLIISSTVTLLPLSRYEILDDLPKLASNSLSTESFAQLGPWRTGAEILSDIQPIRQKAQHIIL